jgi:hypothetical protein
MFLLGSLLFILTIISYWRCISNKKRISNSSEILSQMFNDNVDIMQHLGYYNVNINATKLNFIMECLEHLLYSSNPNYDELCCFSWDKFNLDDNFKEQLENNFINYCTTIKKNKTDFTVNEITSFIKKQEVYKKLETKLNYTMLRAIVLSKYLNDNITDNLIDVLSIDEKNILTA